ncbi:MAG: AI-2E family transporter [Chitinophagaceae bacterium]|nr:AI-2E family transporter [Chitinophagaceae bacterium]
MDTTTTPTTLPLYARLSMTTIGLAAFFYILYIGQDILVPLIFATIIAILLNPVINFLCRKGMNKVVAILLVLIVALVAIGALMYFMGSQISSFSESMPELKQKTNAIYNDITTWVSQKFNVGKPKIAAWVDKTKGEGMNNSSAVIGETIGTIGGVLVLVFLLPVYTFMILFYKPLLLEFIGRLFQRDKHKVVAEVLMQTKVLIQSYLVGLMLEAALVAVLNSAALLIIGIKYAVLIGIIGALLNIIPYIGGLVAISIPMLLAIATKEPIDALWVFIAYIMVQFIDNNLFVPKIVASKVKINALVSIIVVLIGGALWGVAGMFLSIPLTAIVKVIFDRIEPLAPFGFLLGDNQPEIGKSVFNFKYPIKKKAKPKVVKEG